MVDILICLIHFFLFLRHLIVFGLWLLLLWLLESWWFKLGSNHSNCVILLSEKISIHTSICFRCTIMPQYSRFAWFYRLHCCLCAPVSFFVLLWSPMLPLRSTDLHGFLKCNSCMLISSVVEKIKYYTFWMTKIESILTRQHWCRKRMNFNKWKKISRCPPLGEQITSLSLKNT